MNNIISVGDMMPTVLESLRASGFMIFQIERASNLADLDTTVVASTRAVLCGPVEGLSGADMDRLPSLEIISNFGVGYDNVDVSAAAERDIVVTHTPGVLNDEVADTTVALTIMVLRRLTEAERYLRDGRWPNGPFPLTRHSLVGARVGIAGMGRVGKTILARFASFEVSLTYTDLRRSDEVDAKYIENVVQLAKSCDVLISTLPGGSATQGILNKEVFEALGPNGTFINVGRGEVVNEVDLVDCLGNRSLGGAGLDVFRTEPNVPTALINSPNAVLLPHVGSASEPTREKMAFLVADNVRSWFQRGSALTAVQLG